MIYRNEFTFSQLIPNIWGFAFNIYTMAEASDFKFDTQLGFANAHHKITPIEKVGMALG